VAAYLLNSMFKITLVVIIKLFKYQY